LIIRCDKLPQRLTIIWRYDQMSVKNCHVIKRRGLFS